MIHKPSAIILGLLCSGGGSNRPMCESVSFKNWGSGETSIVRFRPQKSGIRYRIKIPTKIPPEFATKQQEASPISTANESNTLCMYCILQIKATKLPNSLDTLDNTQHFIGCYRLVLTRAGDDVDSRYILDIGHRYYLTTNQQVELCLHDRCI
jgi:hypothetical protein